MVVGSQSDAKKIRMTFLTPEEININQDCDTEDEESEYVETRNQLCGPLASSSPFFPPPPPPLACFNLAKNDEHNNKDPDEGEEKNENEEDADDEEDMSQQDLNEQHELKKEEEEEEEDPAAYDDEVSPEMYLFEKIMLSIPLQAALSFKKRISKGVYLVTRHSDDKTLCLKFVRRRSKYQTRMPIELRILSHIQSFPKIRHLQKLEGVFITDSYYAFLSEYIPDLLRQQSTIHQRPLELRELLRQLLVGIRQLHRNGIIHRDIKPANVLWNSKSLTIVDFDKATWNTKEGHHILTGTAGFIAPEVLRYERDGHNIPKPYNEKCDIYSAGMMFGCLLFNVSEASSKEMHASIFREEAHRYLPALTAQILKRMIRFNPNKRPSAHTLLQSPYFQKIKN